MIRSLFLLVALSSPIFAQNISMTDFRIPDSRYTHLLGGFDGYYGMSRNGYSSSGASKTNTGNYNLSLQALVGRDNENESYVMNANLYGWYNTATTDGDYIEFPHRYQQKNSSVDARLSASGRYASYLTPDRLYLYGSASVDASYDDNSMHIDTSSVTFQSTFSKDRAIDGSIGGGIGFGKMRDASAIFAVVRIIEKLNEDGYLTRELSRNEILEVVDIYARRIEYTTGHERPTKYFLESLLRKLESFGVLKDNRVTAYEAERVVEVFQENIFPRMVGWTIRGGVEIGRSQREHSGSSGYRAWEVMKSDRNTVVIGTEYGHPFSVSLHWYTIATVSVPAFGKQKKVDQLLQSSLYYQLGERISNELGATYTKKNRYEIGGGVPDTENSQNALTIRNTVRYFIEDNISFSVMVGYIDQMTINEYQSSKDRWTQGAMEVIFGLNYRFF